MSGPGRKSGAPEPGARRLGPGFNWVWLADVRHGRAVEVLDRRHTPDPRLDRLFDRVERCRPGPGAFELEVEDGAADVVVLHDLLPGAAARVPRPARGNGARPAAPEVAVLAECRRVLGRSGALQLLLDNALWHRNLRRRLDPRDRGPEGARPVRPGAVRGWLRRAGFEEARVYYVSPRSGFPEGLIPASGAALDAHERLRGTASGLRRVARRLLARAGMGPVLHPRFLVLALA